MVNEEYANGTQPVRSGRGMHRASQNDDEET